MGKIRTLLNRLKKSKDGRTLVANFGYLSLLQVAGYVFPLITMPYLARVIGVEGFGKIAFAAAIMVWIQTIADWGFNYTATRDVARNRDNKEIVSDIFSRVFWARCLLMMLSFLVLLVLVLCIPKLRENAAVIFVTFLMIPGHIMFPDWFFQAIERMKYTTLLNLLSKLLFTILIFVFIKEKDDYILQPLFVSLGFVLSGIIAMYYILIRWKVKLTSVPFKSVIRTIKSSTDVFINNIVPNFYNAFSTLLLGFFYGSTANGILDAGKKFLTIGGQFLGVFSRTFYPFLSRKIDKHSFYAKVNISVVAVISICLFVFAPLLIKIFFTKDFAEAVTVLRITSVSLLFESLKNVYGINYMLIQGYEKQMRNIMTICAFIGFALSFPLVYKYSYIGAAMVYTFTLGIMGISSMIFVKIKQGKNGNINSR